MKRYQVHVEKVNNTNVTWDYDIVYESQRCSKAVRTATELRKTKRGQVLVFDTKKRDYTRDGRVWMSHSVFVEMRRVKKRAERFIGRMI